MSITKNRQSMETLRKMAAAAFPEKELSKATELTEGMFNAAYRVEFTDGSASILKISAGSEEGFLSNEINLMQAEVSAMELLGKEGMTCVPAVQFSDFSRSLCSGSYFFMEVLPGRSLFSLREEVTQEIRSRVLFEAGQLQRRLWDVKGEGFGLLGDSRRFSTLYAFMEALFQNVLSDAAKRNIPLGIEPDELFGRLRRDRCCFEEVRVPSLVHWDMWEGNIFVDEGKLSGVIDWERAMWSDPLMDDRFRSRNHNPAFMEGYGVKEFSAAESRRILWYDLFLNVTMMTETFYRQYENAEGEIQWLTPQVEKAWAGLEQPVEA